MLGAECSLPAKIAETLHRPEITRGRKKTAVDPRVKKLEQENRRFTSRLEHAEAVIAFQKKVAELLGIPLRPFAADETE
jgi:hypothetical protein